MMILKAALCAAVAVCANPAAAATLSIDISGSGPNSATVLIPTLPQGIVVNSVTYTATYSISQSFGTTNPNPFTVIFNGGAGSILFGSISFSGEQSVRGPGEFGIGQTGSTSGVITTGLDRFVGPNPLSVFANGGINLVNSGATNTGRGSFTARYLLTYDFMPVAAIPEPSTWAMMLAGFGLAGYTLRRRSRVAFA